MSTRLARVAMLILFAGASAGGATGRPSPVSTERLLDAFVREVDDQVWIGGSGLPRRDVSSALIARSRLAVPAVLARVAPIARDRCACRDHSRLIAFVNLLVLMPGHSQAALLESLVADETFDLQSRVQIASWLKRAGRPGPDPHALLETPRSP